ncbi:MAG TPA: PAS domain-containing sensor histidine kinase, partial [Myxococcota bacterium]|nr:PAS domain-containing sensor histidine kinase [Myxococcota bacterium]
IQVAAEERRRLDAGLDAAMERSLEAFSPSSICTHETTAPCQDTVDARATAEQLRRSEERYYLATLATSELIWDFDPETGQTQWSDAACRLLGHVRPRVDRGHEWWKSRVDTRDRERACASWDAAVAEGRGVWSDHYRFHKADGELIHIIDRAVLTYGPEGRLLRAVGAMHDDTERLRAEAALRRSEAENRAVCASLTEGVTLHDSRGRLRLANASAQRLLRLSFDEIAALAPRPGGWQTVREDGSPLSFEENPTFIAARTGKAQRNVVVGVRTPGADTQWLSMSCEPIFDNDGELTGVVSSFFDITAQKCRADFEQQIIGIVSHDLRNPISAIMLASSRLLQRGPRDARETRVLHKILTATERIDRLIHDLLDFTQARASTGIPVMCRPCDAAKVVRDTVEELRMAHPDRVIEAHADTGVRGTWDPDRLAQLLTNLLNNALQHSPAAMPVSVRVEASATALTLTVHNFGDPIPEELLPHVTEPFKRGASEETSKQRSIGLGLFIVDQIVRAHGGRLEVTSGPEIGTSFTVRLPRELHTESSHHRDP